MVSIAWPMTGKTIIATGAGVQTQPRRLQDQFTPTGSSPALVKKSECALRGSHRIRRGSAKFLPRTCERCPRAPSIATIARDLAEGSELP